MQCMAIERKSFAKHEAMDIAYELESCVGVTLLCACPRSPWVGPAVGASAGGGDSEIH